MFNEAIYASHLEHSQKGQTWGKHKYLYITETGRYVYPEDLQNGAKNLGNKASAAVSSAGSRLSGMVSNTGQSARRFGQGIKTSYEAGKAAGTAVANAGKPKTSDQVPDKQTDPKNALDISDIKKMEINTAVKNRDDVIKNISLKFLRGDYGEGDEAKKKLGKYYNEIMQKTDDLVKSGVVRKDNAVDAAKKEVEEKKKEVNNSKAAKALKDTAEGFKKFGNDVKASYEAGKKVGAAVAEAEKRKKKAIKHSGLDEDNFLMHWGKKHRSGRYKFGSGNRPYQHEARNHSWYDRRTMPMEDLDKAITRARKELDLYNAERNNRSAAQKFVEDVLTSVGKTVIISAVTGGLNYAGKQFVEKSLENPELATAMFGNNNGGGKKNKKNKK